MKEKEISARQQKFIASLWRDLGISGTMPTTSRAASRLIDSLLKRKERAEREADRRQVAAKPASAEVQESIRARAARLGLHVKASWLTEGEARFVLDDLRARERRMMRTADGSAG
jgi:hypothetical protein